MGRVRQLVDHWFGGAPVDLAALETPVYPIACAPEVTIEVAQANGLVWDEQALADVIQTFGGYLSGKVKVVRCPPVAIDVDGAGAGGLGRGFGSCG